jgi:CRISPR/Cas system CSM-associated protein Csm3 (group 7 of RAMP superfamily)
MTLRAQTKLPVGTVIAIWLRLDETPDPPDLWEITRAALATWQPMIGGGVTRGFGRAHVTEIRHGVLDLDNRDHLDLWLRSGGPELVETIATESLDLVSPVDESRTFLWRVADGLHIGSGATLRDKTPSVSAVLRSNGLPIVPGSTWKGILRSRVEYILASCGQRHCLDAACGQCAACALFGYAERETTPARPGQVTGDPHRSVGRRGLLTFDDSPVTIPADGPANIRHRTHVAVDRITGGARDKLLYTWETVEHGETTLRIRPLDTVPDWGWGLLLLAIRDIHDGFVGIGGGVTRGQGTFHLIDPSPLHIGLDGPEGEAVRHLLSGASPDLAGAVPA